MTLLFAITANHVNAQPKYKFCIVSVKDDTGKFSTDSLRHSIEAALNATGMVNVLSYDSFAKAAILLGIEPEHRSRIESLTAIAKREPFDVAIMVFVSRDDKKYRLYLAAIDLRDGSRVGKASLRLSRPRLSDAGARELMTPLVAGVLEEFTQRRDQLALQEQVGKPVDRPRSAPADTDTGWGSTEGDGWGTVESSGQGGWGSVESPIATDVSLEAGGFLLAHFGGIIGDHDVTPKSGDVVVGEERFGFDVHAWSRSVEASAQVKGDLYYDNLFNKFGFALREGFVDYRYEQFDFRIGRQVATWGASELVAVNDIFPRDWEAYFLGKPIDYFKLGVDGLRIRYTSRLLALEWLVMPVFTPDKMPESDRFVLTDPFVNYPKRVEVLPDNLYEDVEFGIKGSTRFGNVDLAAHLYRGFWRMPSFMFQDDQLLLIHPELDVAGLHVQTGLLGTVLSVELGYYFSPEDRDGDIYEIPNSQMRALASFQVSLWSNFTLTAQYYLQQMMQYQDYVDSVPVGFQAYQESEFRHAVTLRLEQSLFDQNFKMAMVGYYSYSDEDFFVQPQLSYNISDKFAVTAGGTLVHGSKLKPWATAGALRQNDNLFVSVRHFF